MSVADTAATHGEKLILVVGARRSGTNWVERLITAHPDVVGIPGESYLFSRGVVPLMERLHHGSPGTVMVGSLYADRETALQAIRQLCDSLLGPHLEGALGSPTRLVERTPENVLHLSRIAEIYPAARFVHVIRNGFEVVRSLLNQSWGPTHAQDAADEWRESVTAGLTQGKPLAGYVEVRYEELSENAGKVIRELYESLDLDCSADVVADAVAEAAVVRNTAGRPRAAGALTRRQVDEVLDRAGPLLDELGMQPPEHVRQPGLLEQAAWLVSKVRTPKNAREEPAPAPQVPAPPRSLHRQQAVLDELLAALRAGTDMSSSLTEDARLRVIGPDEEVFHGPGAAVRFRDHLSGDPLTSWSVRRSDAHPAGGMVTVASSLAGPGGKEVDRTVIVRFDGDLVSELVVYRHPVHAHE